MAATRSTLRYAGLPLLAALCFTFADVQAQARTADSVDVTTLVKRISLRAQDGDPALRAARANLRAAEAMHAAAGFAPPMTAQVGLMDGPSFNVGQGNIEFEVGRELFLGRRLAAARAMTEASVGAARAEVEARARLVEVQVLEAVVHAAGAARIAQRLQRSDTWLSAAEEALQSRFAVGTARYVDVLRIRTERLQLGADLSRAREDGASAVASLVGLVGATLTPDSLRAMVALASVDAREWRTLLVDVPTSDSLLALFTDVRAASAEVAHARAGVLSAAASRRPQFMGSAGLQRIGVFNGGPTAGLLLGFSSTLPFTARTANERLHAAAEADVAAAGERIVAARAASTAAIDAARVRYDAARLRLDGLDLAQLVAADAEREAALAEYRAGTLSLLELLDFERALLRVEVERIHALLDAVSALAEVYGLPSIDSGASK